MATSCIAGIAACNGHSCWMFWWWKRQILFIFSACKCLPILFFFLYTTSPEIYLSWHFEEETKHFLAAQSTVANHNHNLLILCCFRELPLWNCQLERRSRSQPLVSCNSCAYGLCLHFVLDVCVAVRPAVCWRARQILVPNLTCSSCTFK